MSSDEKKKDTPRTLVEKSLIYSQVSQTVRLRKTPQRLLREKQQEADKLSTNIPILTRPNKINQESNSLSTFTNKKRKSRELEKESCNDADGRKMQTPRTLVENLFTTNEIQRTTRKDPIRAVGIKLRPLDRLARVEISSGSDSPATQIRKTVLQNVKQNQEKFKSMPPRKKKRLSELPPLNKTIEPEVAEFADKLSQNIPSNRTNNSSLFLSPQPSVTPRYQGLLTNAEFKRVRAKRISLDTQAHLKVVQTPSTDIFFKNLLKKLPKEIQRESHLEAENTSKNVSDKSVTEFPDEGLSQTSSTEIFFTNLLTKLPAPKEIQTGSMPLEREITSKDVSDKLAAESYTGSEQEQSSVVDLSASESSVELNNVNNAMENAIDQEMTKSKLENNIDASVRDRVDHSTIIVDHNENKTFVNEGSVNINRSKIVSSTPQGKQEPVNSHSLSNEFLQSNVATERSHVSSESNESSSDTTNEENENKKAGKRSVLIQTMQASTSGNNLKLPEVQDEEVSFHPSRVDENVAEIEDASESDVDIMDEELIESDDENVTPRNELFTLQTPKVDKSAFNRFQDVLGRYFDKVPQETRAAPAPVKKMAAKKPNLPCSSTQFKSILRHHCTTRVTPRAMDFMEKVTEIYMSKTSRKLDRICRNNGKKIITQEHVETLMKKRGFVTKEKPLRILIEQNLPLEYRELLIPMAMPGNKVFPEKCLLSKEH